MREFICNITGFVLYVSDNGIITRGSDSKVLTKHLDKDGYHYVTIKSKGVRKNFKVHRLVGECFLDNPQNKPCINHKDGVKANNEVSNLEWCTYKENMRHAVETGLHTKCFIKGEKHSTSKFSFEDIVEIRSRYMNEDITMRKLALEYNTSSGYISDVVNSKIRINC